MGSAERGEMLVKQTGRYKHPEIIDCLDVIEWLKQNRAATELRDAPVVSNSLGMRSTVMRYAR